MDRGKMSCSLHCSWTFFCPSFFTYYLLDYIHHSLNFFPSYECSRGTFGHFWLLNSHTSPFYYFHCAGFSLFVGGIAGKEKKYLVHCARISGLWIGSSPGAFFVTCLLCLLHQQLHVKLIPVKRTNLPPSFLLHSYLKYCFVGLILKLIKVMDMFSI